MWYVVDNKRRVWAERHTPRAANIELERIRNHIRTKRPTQAPDPATLKVVSYDPVRQDIRKQLDRLAGL